MNKQELKKAFDEKLITEQQYKDELFKLATTRTEKKQSKKLPVFLTKEEFGKLIDATEQKHHKLAFLLGFGSGMRISEIINLKPEHIHVREKNIFISLGKGSKDRIVPLPKGFKEEHLSLFPIDIGSRALQKAFKTAAKNAGLLAIKPTLHVHSLRHSFATNAVANGVPIHYVRTLMGHSNISTTNIYLTANPLDALKSYEDKF